MEKEYTRRVLFAEFTEGNQENGQEPEGKRPQNCPYLVESAAPPSPTLSLTAPPLISMEGLVEPASLGPSLKIESPGAWAFYWMLSSWSVLQLSESSWGNTCHPSASILRSLWSRMRWTTIDYRPQMSTTIDHILLRILPPYFANHSVCTRSLSLSPYVTLFF